MRDLGILLEKAEVLGKFTDAQKQQLVSLAVRRVLERAEALFWQEGSLRWSVFFPACALF